MNKRQIVNQTIIWPEINENVSKNITDIFSYDLSKYESIKRAKTLPKRIRLKIKQNKLTDTNNLELTNKTTNEEILVGKLLKRHFRFGINSVTRTLENEPSNILFVLVCRSCMPLNILTRHIQIMCSMNNIPAGCIYNLSSNISKLLAIKTVSCMAVCKLIKNSDVDLTEDVLKKVGIIIENLNTKITPQLPRLPNLLSENIFKRQELLKKLENYKEIMMEIESNEASNELLNVNNKKIDIEKENEKEKSYIHENQNFGSDFITFIESNDSNNDIDFHSTDFILFNDNLIIKPEKIDSEMNEDDDVFKIKLNQLSIKQRTENSSNKEKKKQKKKLKLIKNMKNSGFSKSKKLKIKK